MLYWMSSQKLEDLNQSGVFVGEHVFVEQSKLPIALGQTQHSNTSVHTNGGSAHLEKPSLGSNGKAFASPSPKSLQNRTDIFPENLSKPATRTRWPKFDDHSTPRLSLPCVLPLSFLV
ncbi:hypothetical protein BGZ96_001321 [Linnemannia gamsii]|uniref:Uncharacterized protein n=1 Tax=Linnemannia gamsii TaxID=64522 RepID=A0ABQ7JMH5_9FUNG|nr:hypothetical protein BGZ96_001321 [Linnemannia gamsii]